MTAAGAERRRHVGLPRTLSAKTLTQATVHRPQYDIECYNNGSSVGRQLLTCAIVPGPCRYCARTGATCTIATPRRKRPYYHVTEEEYQCSMRILEHFFPGHELNLQSLRTIAKAIREGTFAAPPVQQTEGLFTENQATSEDGESVDDAEEQDVSELHEPLGCMMKDSIGKFRYVGAHSEIPFNAAVATLGSQRRNPAIIPTPRLGDYPPKFSGTSPSSDVGVEESYYLPGRELCDIYVSRFLEDVHCTYWFYPVENLLRRVQDTYTESAPRSSSSWMCSLYAMFAIGAANYTGTTGNSPPPDWPAALDQKTSEDYITLAKQLIPIVYDEADVDSIRAMAIMVRFLSTRGNYLANPYPEHRNGEYVLESKRLPLHGS